VTPARAVADPLSTTMRLSLSARLLTVLAACTLLHCASGSTGGDVSGDDSTPGSSGGTSGGASSSGASSSGGSSGGSSGSTSGSSSGGGDDDAADSTVDDEGGALDATVDAPSTDATGGGGEGAAPEASPGDATTIDATMPVEASAPEAGGNPVDAGPDAIVEASVDAGGGASEGAAPDDAGGDCAPNGEFTQTSFVSLAVPPGAPLSQTENDPLPGDGGAGPAGWNFYQISGAECRDGSPTGFYVHYGTAPKLFIYLEGGGACSSATFCSHNPANMNQSFPGGAPTQGQTIGGSIAAFSTTPQQPYVPTPASGLTAAYSPGIFDFTNAANPLKDWSGVYVPYCTGDVHFGTADNVTIPSDGVLPALTGQHFVGHLNLQRFIARIVPTFPSVTQVLLAGASAGGFGAGLNYGMVQDSFGEIPVTVLDDSGPPFRVAYLPACVQEQWRELWGFNAALPSDCAECFRSDGSGLTDLVLYWNHKYANARVGLVSTIEDEVMRLFFASGDDSCASNNATLLDTEQVTGGYTGAEYTAGLQDLVTTYACTGALATYYIGGQNAAFPNPTYHQHIFRQEFYTADTNDGGITMAQWTSNLLSGNLQIAGP
jgi:hypothetical protein